MTFSRQELVCWGILSGRRSKGTFSSCMLVSIHLECSQHSRQILQGMKMLVQPWHPCLLWGSPLTCLLLRCLRDSVIKSCFNSTFLGRDNSGSWDLWGKKKKTTRNNPKHHFLGKDFSWAEEEKERYWGPAHKTKTTNKSCVCVCTHMPAYEREEKGKNESWLKKRRSFIWKFNTDSWIAHIICIRCESWAEENTCLIC